MDSSLLNAYHDDPFDSDFTNFENTPTTDIWSTDNVAIDKIELTDTLDGILPIAATETINDDIYDNEEFISIHKTYNALVYNDFDQQQQNAGQERVGTIEADLYKKRTAYQGDNDRKHDDDDGAQSLCSDYSFRTRTDSSSIGDYESHSSDYDDDVDYDVDYDDDDVIESQNAAELEKHDILMDLPELGLLDADEFIFTAGSTKQRTMSTNTIGSDVDVANFDLAEFITNDDILLAKTNVKQNEAQKIVRSMPQTIAVKVEQDSDTDSDVIVDVETIEIEEAAKHTILLQNAIGQLAEDNLTYVDNVKTDPSWNPKELKIKSAAKPLKTKKPCESLKVVKPRGKLTTAIKRNDKISAKKPVLQSTQTNTQTQCDGLRRGGKNISLLKRDCESIATSNDSKDNKDMCKDLKLLKHDSHSIATLTTQNNHQTSNVISKPNEKRKLNLEEYKRRFGDETSIPNKAKSNEMKSTSMLTSNKPLEHTNQHILIKPKPAVPHSEAVTSIVKTLKAQKDQSTNTKSDPITEARNKVLRMQELKRAQQIKLIDSTISAKVPRVTKLLPLQEIIKDTAYAIKTDSKQEQLKPHLPIKENPNYIKIVMVSVGCNTEVTIAPAEATPSLPLLADISQVAEHVKISNNSLITSIQSAVVKHKLPKLTTAKVPHNTSADHGEDKIIMHLPKDRKREHRCTIETQTDFEAAFPLLPLTKKARRRARQYRKNNSSIAAPENADDKRGNCSRSSSTSSSCSDSDDSCTISSAYRNSENLTATGGTGSIGGYSSRSSRRHRSSVSSSYSESGHQRSSRSRKGRSNYRKNACSRSRSRSSSYSSSSDYSDQSRSRKRSRSRSPYYRNSRARQESNKDYAVEERRIVYVGRIEEETTKEMLRRKFIAYGTIKQITIHYKENGMKYGFVTYDRSEDAFAVIDSSSRDQQINMYDISFGGRRAFCRTSYADLDNAGINNYHSFVFPKTAAQPKQEDSFEALLQKVKAKLDANKSASNNNKP